MLPIGLIVISGVGLYSYFSGEGSTPPTEQVFIEESPVSTPLSAPISVPVEPEGWIRYISPTAAYSFSYPPEWPIHNIPSEAECETCVETIIFAPIVFNSYLARDAEKAIAVIFVGKDSRVQTLEEYVELRIQPQLNQGDYADFQLTTIAGEPAVSYRMTAGFPPLPIIKYVVVQNGFHYDIWIDDSIETNKNREENLERFNTMLESFEFSDVP